MAIHILYVGRDEDPLYKPLNENYLKRFRRPLILHSVPASRHVESAIRKTQEAKAIRAILPKGAAFYILDEHGEDMGSMGFAAWIAGRAQEDQHLYFIIGGADGLAPELVGEAAKSIAFGRATWPHRMVRLMLIEQLYRAETLSQNHPYHRQ